MPTTKISHLYKQRTPRPQGTNFAMRPVFDLGNGSTYTFPATTADVVKIMTLPKGVQLGAAWALILGDHDSGANLVLSLRIYDGTTPRYLIHQTTVGQAGGVAIPSKAPATENAIGFTTDTDLWELEILIDTGAAGGAQAAIAKVQLDISGWVSPGTVSW